MSTEARLARLERRRRAAGEVSDQEHLRVGAAIVLARRRGDDTVVAALRAQPARLPPPAPGGALEAALRCAAPPPASAAPMATLMTICLSYYWFVNNQLLRALGPQSPGYHDPPWRVPWWVGLPRYLSRRLNRHCNDWTLTTY